MSLPCRILSMKHVCALGCAVLLSAALAHAQSLASQTSNSALSAASHLAPVSGWSSSQSGQLQIAEGAAPANPAAALPSAPRAAQDDNDNYSGWHPRDLMHRLTIEGGAGASAPAGDKDYITWGPGFLLGAGVNLNHHLATFIEYQFLDNKVPGAIIAETGTTGGHYHIWSFTLDPELDLFPKSSNDVYLVGGGGFYRKTTNFSVLGPSEYCSYFGYCGIDYVPETVGKLSSNQGGFNIGAGYQHRFGGMYGLSRMRFFAEVRYLDVLSPALRGTAPSGGLGPVTVGADTKLLPITLGVRW